MDRPSESPGSGHPGAPPSPFKGRTAEAIGWAVYHIGRRGRGLWSRNGVPSIVLGSSLLGSVVLFSSSSPWALPVLLAGLALIVVGILGPRLRINAALRWEPEGVELSLNLGVDGHPDRKPLTATATAAPPDPEVIEASAETVEFPAEAVRAALAAAEVAGSDPDATEAPAGTRGFAGVAAPAAEPEAAAAS